jgi:hypothetical protein
LRLVAWRDHVDTKAILRRWDANEERDRRLAEIGDRLYLEHLPEARRGLEILAQEEAARGDGTDART